MARPTTWLTEAVYGPDLSLPRNERPKYMPPHRIIVDEIAWDGAAKHNKVRWRWEGETADQAKSVPAHYVEHYIALVRFVPHQS